MAMEPAAGGGADRDDNLLERTDRRPVHKLFDRRPFGMDLEGDPLHARRALDLDRDGDLSSLIRVIRPDGQPHHVDAVGVQSAGKRLRIKSSGRALGDGVIELENLATGGPVGHAADDGPRGADVECP
jgi:hypothetical protein